MIDTYIAVEVEAVLSECLEEDDSCATLARLKMAIEYEEKKVSNDTLSIIHVTILNNSSNKRPNYYRGLVRL